MTAAKLKPNPAWASRPLFDRTGWKRVRFGDVVENCAETCDPEEAGLERFVAMEHLEPGSLHVRSWGNVADGTTFTRRCRPGQVLFGKRRAYQRKVAVAEFEAVVSGDIYVLAPKDSQRLLPELLPFLCLAERFFQHAVGTSAGSLSPRTNWSSLASFEFDLPPLDQQRRIAEILWAVDETASAYQDQLSALDSAFGATRTKILVSGFSKARCRSTELGLVPESWGMAKLSEVLSITAGNAFKSEDFCERGVQLIRLGNLYDRRLDLSRNPVFLPSDFEAKHPGFVVRPGDTLFSMTGTMGKEDYGYAVVVPDGIAPTLLNQRVAKLTPRPNVLPEYLLHYLWSRLFLDQIYSKAAGSKQANISNKDIYASIMPLPPIDEQRAIASRLNDLYRAKQCTSEAISRAGALLSELINSIT